MRPPAVAAVLLAAALAACGSGTEVDDLRLVRTVLGQRVASRTAPPVDPAITRASIDAVGKPLLQVRLERPEAIALLGLIGTNGRTVTWASVDGLTVSLTDGIVVATRGFGDDLMSAAIPGLGQIARGEGSVARTHYSLAGFDREQAMPYRCTLATVANERLVLYGLSYAVRHIQESCEGAGPAFRNDYWIEIGGILRQSRQWIGESVGYLQLQLVSR